MIHIITIYTLGFFQRIKVRLFVHAFEVGYIQHVRISNSQWHISTFSAIVYVHIWEITKNDKNKKKNNENFCLKFICK